MPAPVLAYRRRSQMYVASPCRWRPDPKNVNDGCPYNASAFVKTKECRLRFDSVAQPTRGQQGWTYLNFVHTSLQGELLPVQRRFLLCFGRLNVALLFVKEVIWKFVTGFVSGEKEQSNNGLTSCRAQREVHAGLL